MKGLARSFVYWPRIDQDIEEMVGNCAPCQVNARAVSIPSHPWIPPTRPWERVHIDYAGPFLQHSFLVVIDAFSKWPEIFPVPSSTANGTNTAATIEKLLECFARFGFPETLVSDNGVQFTSKQFRKFCEINYVKQIWTAPYHPQSNGQAERMVQTFKRALRIAIAEKTEGSIMQKLQTFLMAYRRAPLGGGESPSQRMFGRTLRSRVDLLKGVENVSTKLDDGVADGTPVWFRVFQGPQNWDQGTLIRRLGNVMVEVKDRNGQTHRRHLAQVRRARTSPEFRDAYPVCQERENEPAAPATGTVDPTPSQVHAPPRPQATSATPVPLPTVPSGRAVPRTQRESRSRVRTPPGPRRSSRTRKGPNRFSP